MEKIKNKDAYFHTALNNSYKNEYRANDNFFKHISSVGDGVDIQRHTSSRAMHAEPDSHSIEHQLCEGSVDNWLMFMENKRLHNILSRLPQADVELLFLLYSVRLRQTDIAILYGVSQGAIGWRHKRLKKIISDFLQNTL